MTFIVTVIAIAIERFFDWSHLRNWRWFKAYQAWVAQKSTNFSAYTVLAAILLPIVLGVFSIQLMLTGWWYGLFNLLFQLLILLYCFGPQNLWADTFASINHAMHENQETEQVPKTLSNDIDVQHIFIEANRRVFAVIFWFVLLGPAGAILYRMVAELNATNVTQLKLPQRQLLAILDWVPVRLFTFLFALGGHFAQVLVAWRQGLLQGLSANETLLADCGVAALGGDTSPVSTNVSVLENQAISLIDRAFILLLILVAIVDMIL